MSRMFSLTCFLVLFVGFALPLHAATLAIGSTHYVYNYDLESGVSTSVWSDPNAYLGGLGYDAGQDDVYYHRTSGVLRRIMRDTEPSQFYPGYSDTEIEVERGGIQLDLVFGDLDVGPGSKLAYTYWDPRSASQTFTRYTGVAVRDVVTNLETNLYSVGRYQIVGWSGYYDPKPIWQKVHEISGVAVDSFGEFAYFTDGVEGTINRVRVNGEDGGARDVLVSGLTSPHGVSVYGSNIYWTEAGAIRRSDLLGGDVTDLIFLTESPLNLAVGENKIFWTKASGGTVMQANLDGSGIQELAEAPQGTVIAFSSATNAVPEPTSLAMFAGLGVMGLIAARRRKRAA